LMVVMAIMAVLSGIVIPAVTGTKQVSIDSQVRQDASVIETAVSDYNADANLAENITTDDTTTVVGETASQVTSNKWPEATVSAKYGTAFPLDALTTVTSVTIKDEDGTVVYGTGVTDAGLAEFVLAYNAVDTSKLVGYIQEVPAGFGAEFESKGYHNYLWLVKKVAVGDDADGGRAVTVFSLTVVDTAAAGTDSLTYEQIY